MENRENAFGGSWTFLEIGTFLKHLKAALDSAGREGKYRADLQSSQYPSS